MSFLNFFDIKGKYLLIIIVLLFFFSKAQTDESLNEAIKESIKTSKTKEYTNFFDQTVECTTKLIANLCDTPLEASQQKYPCLDKWFECSKKTPFYNKTKNLYQENAALQSAYNFSFMNPLKWGSDPIDLITNTNNFVFLLYSAKFMLKEKLDEYSKTTDFYNQMVTQYFDCVNLVVGENQMPLCGTTVSSCMNAQKNCLFKVAPFFMSFFEDIPLDLLLDSQEYVKVKISTPECDTTNSCNSTEQKDYLQQRWNAFDINLIAYLFKDIEDTKGGSVTVLYIILGIIIAILLVGILLIIIIQCRYYKNNKDLLIQEYGYSSSSFKTK